MAARDSSPNPAAAAAAGVHTRIRAAGRTADAAGMRQRSRSAGRCGRTNGSGSESHAARSLGAASSESDPHASSSAVFRSSGREAVGQSSHTNTARECIAIEEASGNHIAPQVLRSQAKPWAHTAFMADMTAMMAAMQCTIDELTLQ